MRDYRTVVLLGVLQCLGGCSTEGHRETNKPPTVTSQPRADRDLTEEEALAFIRKTPDAFVWESSRRVRISLTCWPEEAIAKLKYVRRLRSLAICSPRIPDSGLARLGKLDFLRDLSLSGPTSDSGMQELKGMAQLQSIHLASAEITDVGLAVLLKLPQLKDVRLWRCRQVTDAGVDRLRKRGISVRISGLDGR